MAIKAGQIVHAGNGVAVIDRIQTGGPGQLNIPTEKINELGNYKSVATIRDIPDLTFTAESFDVSTEFELLVCGATTIDPADGLDLAKCRPVDIASQFKAGLTAADPTLVTTSVALPYLYLEQMSYRFGLRDNATVSGTLRGDTIFYNPGATFVETTPGTGLGRSGDRHRARRLRGGRRRQPSRPVGHRRHQAAHPRRRLHRVLRGRHRRRRDHHGDAGQLAVPLADDVRIMYSSPSPTQYAQSVHPDTTVKPAAVRGRDIEVYVGDYDPTDVPGCRRQQAHLRPGRPGRLAGHRGEGRGVRQLLRGRHRLRGRAAGQRLGRHQAPRRRRPPQPAPQDHRRHRPVADHRPRRSGPAAPGRGHQAPRHRTTPSSDSTCRTHGSPSPATRAGCSRSSPSPCSGSPTKAPCSSSTSRRKRPA